MQKMCATLLLFLLPSLVFAAGFAKQSLFLSKSSVIEGDTVRIYAVVSNDTQSIFIGTVTLEDEEGVIGSAPVSLQVGSATTVSVSWTPTAGKHAVVANLINASSQIVESDNASFLIYQSPTAAEAADATRTASTTSDSALASSSTTTIQSSQVLQQWVANTVPPVAAYTGPIFNAVDSARSAGAQKLGSGSTWAQDSLTKAASAPSSSINTFSLIMETIVLYICSTFGFVVANIGIFYPLMALIFFYILWRIYRLFRRRY